MGHHGNSFLSFPAVGEVGGWVELGRTTLGSAGDTIDVSGLADKRYYQILCNGINSGTIAGILQVGNSTIDSGTNYARRFSTNGGGDFTDTNSAQLTALGPGVDTFPEWTVGYIANLSAKEKLGIFFAMAQNTAGAGNAPTRRENVGKWVNTSNPLDIMRMFSGSGDYAIGSEFVVLGWDPADTHTTNFWEVLADVDLSTGEDDTISSGTFAARKYLWYQMFHIPKTSFNDSKITFNSDTASNYSFRSSANGGTDSTTTSTTGISLGTSSTWGNVFNNGFIVNNSANEKLLIHHLIGATTAGAANAPRRAEFVGKWANTSAQITDITFTSQSANYDTGTFLKVWGSN